MRERSKELEQLGTIMQTSHPCFQGFEALENKVVKLEEEILLLKNLIRDKL